MENGYPVHDNDAPLQIFVAGFIAERQIGWCPDHYSGCCVFFFFCYCYGYASAATWGKLYSLKSPATFVFLLGLDSYKQRQRFCARFPYVLMQLHLFYRFLFGRQNGFGQLFDYTRCNKKIPSHVTRDDLFKGHPKICIAEALLFNHFKLIGFYQTLGRLWPLLDYVLSIPYAVKAYIKFRIYSPYYAFENCFRYIRSL